MTRWKRSVRKHIKTDSKRSPNTRDHTVTSKINSEQGNRVLQKLITTNRNIIVQTKLNGQLIQRSNYRQIKENLSYGIFDWVITDAEAREVLRVLNSLDDNELLRTIRRMLRADILDRLYDNISSSDRRVFAPLLTRIREIEAELENLPVCCKDTLRWIDQRIRASGIVSGLLGTAPMITTFGEQPAHSAEQLLLSDWDLYRAAIRAVPIIFKDEIHDVIRLHLLDHLNSPEESFWQRMEQLWH